MHQRPNAFWQAIGVETESSELRNKERIATCTRPERVREVDRDRFTGYCSRTQRDGALVQPDEFCAARAWKTRQPVDRRGGGRRWQLGVAVGRDEQHRSLDDRATDGLC